MWQATAVQVGGNVVVTAVGTVTAGKFLGKSVVRQTASLQSQIRSACATSGGLKQVRATATLSISGL
jgi:hypothetical protein